MYLLLTDETNLEKNTINKFLIYGGIFFNFDIFLKIDKAIEKIKINAGYEINNEFKFDSRSRPNQISLDDFTKAKNDVIDICLKYDCKFIVYVALHNIIRNKSRDEKITYAADHVIGRFNKYLEEINDYGICVVDNLPITSNYKYLAKMFQSGLMTTKQTLLKRIRLYASSCINASNVSSAMDIILGSFRYCINDPKNINAAKCMIKKVIKMMWQVKEGNKILVDEKGLIMRPLLKRIKVPEYKNEYIKLYKNINYLLNI